jgi:hypothetical protein
MSCHVLSSWLRMWSHVLSKISSWVPTRCILAVWRGQWPNRKSSIQPDHNHLIIFLSLKSTLQRQTFWVGNNLHEHSYDMFWLTSKVFVVNHDIYIYTHIYIYNQILHIWVCLFQVPRDSTVDTPILQYRRTTKKGRGCHDCLRKHIWWYTSRQYRFSSDVCVKNRVASIWHLLQVPNNAVYFFVQHSNLFILMVVSCYIRCCIFHVMP